LDDVGEHASGAITNGGIALVVNPPGDRLLTAVLGKRILTKDGGKFRPVTVAEPELYLRWLWRHYQNPYFNATKAVDE
jgi:hypothetical protein